MFDSFYDYEYNKLNRFYQIPVLESMSYVNLSHARNYEER